MTKVQPDPMTARDLVGYGEFPPNPDWPGEAVIAVNFNLNVEGGGEATLANGDDGSEGMLNDIGVPAVRGRRVPLVESDRKSTRLNSSHVSESRMPSSA